MSIRLLLGSLLLLAALVAAIALFAWSSRGEVSTKIPSSMPSQLAGKPQGHVYTGAVEEPSDVNPMTARGAVAQSLVLGVTHDALLDRDPQTGELRKALAQSYEVSADGLACTFVLRDGVVFSDGTTVSMADVVFGWELAKAGHLSMGFVGAAFARVQSVEILGERTLRVQFRDRYFANVASVGEGWLVANKAFFVENVRRRCADGESMPSVDSARFAELFDQVNLEPGPGTGPYALHGELGQWRVRQSLLLSRHETSWRRRARPGSWNFGAIKLLFRDQAGARNALLLGDIDWYSGADLDVLLEQHDVLRGAFRKQVYDFPQLGVYRLVWNCRRQPYDDVRVRRALSMLIPREDAVAVMGGDARVATAHAKPGSPAYPDDAVSTFDPAAARQLLRLAGFDPEQGKPLRMQLLALQGSEPLRRITELFRGAAKQAGVLVEVQSRELSAFVAEQQRGDWDGSLVLQWFDASGDPYRFLHSEGRSNPGGWKNSEADQLATAARLELDPAARNEIWKRLHSLANAEQPAALIVHPVATVLLSRHLRECVPGAYGLRPEWAWVPVENQRR